MNAARHVTRRRADVTIAEARIIRYRRRRLFRRVGGAFLLGMLTTAAAMAIYFGWPVR